MAGADCPDWFVCDDEAVQFYGVNVFESSFELIGDNFIGFARFTFGESFTDTEDWGYALVKKGFEFEVYCFVGFGEESDG